MVNVALQEAVVALSHDERVELRDFIDMTLTAEVPVLSAEQRATIRRRSAEMDANPSIGIPWEELYAELMADLR